MKASAPRATHKRPDPKDPSKKINVVPSAIPIREAVTKYYAQPGRQPTDTMTFSKQDLPVVNQAGQSASLGQQPPTQQNQPTLSSANDSMFLRRAENYSHVDEEIMSGDSRKILGSPSRAALAGGKRSHSEGGSENNGIVQSARKSPILDLGQGPTLGSAGVFEQDHGDSSDRSPALRSPARASVSLADVGRVPAVGSAVGGMTFAQFWFESSPGKSQLAGDVVSNLLWAFQALIKEGSWFSAPLLCQIIKSIGTLTLATESYKGELSAVYQQKTTDVETLTQSKLVALLLCHVHGAIMQPLVTLSHLSPPLKSLHSSYTHGPQIGNICTDLKRSIQGFYKAVGDAYSHVSRTIDTAVDDGNDHVDHASWMSSFPYKDVNKRRVDAIAQLENATGPVRELQTLLNALKEAEMEVTSRINCLETSIITPAQTVVDDTRVEKEMFKKQAYDVLKNVQGAFGMLFESLDDKSELKTSVLTSAPNVKKDNSLPSSDPLGSIAPTLLATDPDEYMHDGVSTVMQRLHDTGCIYKEGQEPFQFDKQRENELQPGIHKVKIGDLEGFMWLKRSKEQSCDVVVAAGEDIVEMEGPLEIPRDYARLLQDWGQKGTAADDNVDVAIDDCEQAAPESAGLSAGGGSAGSCGNDSKCFVFPAIPVDTADATVSDTFKLFETVENIARGEHIIVIDASMHPEFEILLKEDREIESAAATAGWKLYATIQLTEGKIGIEDVKNGGITLVPFLTPRLDDVYGLEPGYTPWKPNGMHVPLTLLGLVKAKLYTSHPWTHFRKAEPELAKWYTIINTSPSGPITQGLKKGTTGQFYTLNSNINPKKDGVPSVIEVDVTVLYGPIKGLERVRGSTYLVILHNYASGQNPWEIAIAEL
ncbi:hypothetical protein CEUSTIGMA_g12297.t1 [Chlamydomonas eustigma]|uniref:Uncharacterized protein n=1 Tax=Chlamydomonas eustigma TaxID=1157962 RepID=A0A250XPA3_9CHLO|nr:hypothetical protein CEUSTIGMA_g12297.t1 [Chlamydomonas eustigma]|eukprot:GAX84876.1 hypothetical protein CEUSTIGMA_g12297.t1 [Chlamydomonas eustigma]